MPKYKHYKTSGKHTTLTELAYSLVKIIIDDERIKSINFSHLTNSNGARRGRWKVKIIDMPDNNKVFIVSTTQNNSHQFLYITLHKESDVQSLKLHISKIVRDKGWDLSFRKQ